MSAMPTMPPSGSLHATDLRETGPSSGTGQKSLPRLLACRLMRRWTSGSFNPLPKKKPPGISARVVSIACRLPVIPAITHCAWHFEFSLPDTLLCALRLQLQPRISSSTVFPPINGVSVPYQPLIDVDTIGPPAVGNPSFVSILILKRALRRTRRSQEPIKRIGRFLAAPIRVAVRAFAKLRTLWSVDTVEADSHFSDFDRISVDNTNTAGNCFLSIGGNRRRGEQEECQHLQTIGPANRFQIQRTIRRIPAILRNQLGRICIGTEDCPL